MTEVVISRHPYDLTPGDVVVTEDGSFDVEFVEELRWRAPSAHGGEDDRMFCVYLVGGGEIELSGGEYVEVES